MRDPACFVNAFADSFYRGNTAAVMLVESYPEKEKMLALAREFGWSETAFLVRLEEGKYQIRWFTPEVEVPLCGHATLASARTLFELLPQADLILFESLSGPLSARRKGEFIELDFPAEAAFPHAAESEVLAALGAERPVEVLSARNSRNLIAVYADQETVVNLKPDFARLAAMSGLPYYGIAVTAKNTDTDYICRYFAPWEGINEDPVTGSAQTYLAPYWSARLGKKALSGWQASQRGGTFEVEVQAERVLIRGRALIWLRAELEPNWRF